jgi:hypothetical protein
MTPGFELKINSVTACELSAMVNSLARQFGVKLDNIQAEIVAEVEAEEIKSEAVEAPKAKRGRKPKAEEAGSVAVEEVEAPLSTEGAQEPQTSTYTKKDIADACQLVSEKKGLPAAKEILGRFTSEEGEACRKISMVQEKDYATFINACNEAVK